MIKKVFTLLIAGMMSVATLSAHKPILKWASIQDTPLLEIGVDIAPAPDGCTYLLNQFNSRTEPETERTVDYSFINFEDNAELGIKKGDLTVEKTLRGSEDPDLTANGAVNLSLFKVDKNGHALWAINSILGDFSGRGAITTLSDGTLVLALKMRNTKELEPNILIRLVDEDGVETTVTWENTSKNWIYQPVFIKISPEGKVISTKLFKAGTTFEGAQDPTKIYADGFDIKDIVCDENDNLYVSGDFMTSIDLGENANFTRARNVPEDWGGDIQDNMKDMFIVKMDKDFNSIWGTKIEGNRISGETAQNVVYDNGKLIVSGYMKGDGETVVKIGNSEIIPGKQSLFYASVNPENGKFEWAKFLPAKPLGQANSPYMKPMGSHICGNNLYFCGSFQGEIYNGNQVILANDLKKLHAYIIQADLTSGEIRSAVHIKSLLTNPGQANNDILEVQNVFETPLKIIATGYGLQSDSYIYTFDKNLSQESMEAFVTKKSWFGVSSCSTISGTRLVNSMRGRDKVTFPDVDITVQLKTSNTLFGCVFTGHDIEDLATGVSSSISDNNGFKVSGNKYGVVVETEKACSVSVYNMMGALVAEQNVQEGKTTIALEKGIYIVNGVKTVVR